MMAQVLNKSVRAAWLGTLAGIRHARASTSLYASEM
jgi:hypothetical protein